IGVCYRLEWQTRRKSIDCLREWPQMLPRCLFFCGLIMAVTTTLGSAQSPSPNGVKTLNPPGAISTGSDTWSVGVRAGDFIFVAGMQGVDPATNKLVDGDEARIRQAF